MGDFEGDARRHLEASLIAQLLPVEYPYEGPDRVRTQPSQPAACFSGTAAKNGVKSSNPYSHYSLLKFLETVRAGESIGQDDAPAPSRPSSCDEQWVPLIPGENFASTTITHNLGRFP